MTANIRDLDRLAEAVQARRRELGLTLAAAAEAASMAKDTFKRIEAGMRIRDSSYAKVDKALNWAVGSSVDILTGEGGPVTIERGPLEGVVVAAIPDDDLKEGVARAAIAVTDTLTAREIRDLAERVLQELKKFQPSGEE